MCACMFPHGFHLTCSGDDPLWKPGQGRDAVQSGRAEAGDGVPLGLAEKTHGAERVAAEERGRGAQGKQDSENHTFGLAWCSLDYNTTANHCVEARS